MSQQAGERVKAGVNYLDNTENGCKAILDERDSTPQRLPKVCGLPRYEEQTGFKSPYCRAHSLLYTNPMAVRSR
jgi:hypothetical protein